MAVPSVARHEAEPITAINPPFLPRIAYRADDYATLRYRLLEHLRETFPGWNGALAENRGAQDLGVAMAELFAYLGEVLGFYQDCRANEAYLRTAVLPASLLEMAALVDYRPAPGAAAGSLQAFLLKPGGAGAVPAGFQLRTAAVEGRPSLVFETGRALRAHAARNRLRLAGHDRSARRLNAAGVPPDTGVTLDQAYTGLRAGSFVLLAVPGAAARAVQLTAAVVQGKTRITWDAAAIPSNAAIPIADLVIRGNPKQAMAPAARARADEITAGDRAAHVDAPSVAPAGAAVLFVSPGRAEAARIVARDGTLVTWNRGFPISLRRSETRIYAGTPAGHAHGTLRRGAMRIDRASTTSVEPEAGDRLLVADGAGVEQVLVAGRDGDAVLLAEPLPRAFQEVEQGYGHPTVELYRVRLPAPGAAPVSPSTTVARERLVATATELVLDAAYEGLEPGTPLVLHDGESTRVADLDEAAVDEEGRTVLRFAAAVGAAFNLATLRVHGPFSSSMRVDGFDRSEAGTAAGLTTLALDGAVEGLSPGDYLVVEGGGHAEGARIRALAPDGSGKLAVDLAAPLDHAYPLAGTVVYGNVAPVSHGETVLEEGLGSGDASLAGQRFRLRRDPTTWVHDPTGERGVRSTLEVFVSDERWTRVESLAESGPDDRHYAVERDDEGASAVVFGDGRFGARPSTGRNNVRARYRVGLGAQGNVGAGQIAAAVQPLEFVESTRNPVPAAGGADAETPGEVRRLAPLAVRTLDRAVSLADFAELALAYAGIAKARADAGWEGRRRTVVVTVASTGGQPLTPALRDGVKAFLAARAAPGQRFGVRDYRPWPVRLALEVRVLPDFLRLETMVRVREALGAGLTAEGERGFFHFDRRGLGEDLFLSDVYARVEEVRGVDYAVARAFRAEAGPSAQPVRDRIEVPADALATGGHPADPAVGVLALDVTGGIA